MDTGDHESRADGPVQSPSSKTALGRKNSRPRSFNEGVKYAAQMSSSPTNNSSNESILHSLRNAMSNLTSRITRIGNTSANRSANNSPSHQAAFVRSKSVGAENDARIIKPVIDPLSPRFGVARASPPKVVPASGGGAATRHAKEKRKEKRSKLVVSLQRAYGDRVKRRGKSSSPGAHRNSKLYLREAELLSASTSSISAGERLAESSPAGFGQYTLRKPKVKHQGDKQKKQCPN